MAGESGQAATPLIDRMRQAPHEFDFFQAARLIECAHAHLPRIGHAHRAGDEPVRFGQHASLAFAPASLAKVSLEGTRARLLVNFLGLLGPNGPLPLHITEYLRDRELNYDDPTLARFFDIFHHRLISLFYRAWAGAQQAVCHQRPDDDRFAVYIASLIGLGMESLRNRDAVPDEAKWYYSGRLAPASRNAEGLAAIIGDYFGLPTTIEEFVGQWLDLDADRCLRLGASRATGTLGSTAIVGGRIWDRQQRFRIHIGPMDFDAYQRLLPGGASLRRLVAWVRNYLGDEYSFDIRLSLRAQNVPAVQLGRLGQLGWSTWVLSRPHDRVADDLILCPAA